jgi:hypothetical protein
MSHHSQSSGSEVEVAELELAERVAEPGADQP